MRGHIQGKDHIDHKTPHFPSTVTEQQQWSERIDQQSTNQHLVRVLRHAREDVELLQNRESCSALMMLKNL